MGTYFAATVFSQDVGAEKPDAKIFHHAAARLPAARYVMVGDSVSNDVIGAQEAGWLGVWLNRDAASRPPGAEPDLTITTLTAIIDWLEAIDA